MLRSLLAGSFYILVLAFGPSVACADDPVPAAKPLRESGGQEFLEGVDLPRAKPFRPAGKPDAVKAPQTPQAGEAASLPETCHIDGADYRQIEPVSGQIDTEQKSEDTCGIERPVRLVSVGQGADRVSFPGDVTVSCDFARKLVDWLRQDVLPAAQELLGERVTVLGTGPGYQCRRRNNRPDGKVSEHGKGRAIDLAYFQLSEGSAVSVEGDWGTETKPGAFLKSIHAAACRRFTTVLGPEADADHKSHIHVDTGCHGKDCTYLICQ